MPDIVSPDAVLVDTNILLRIAQFQTYRDETLPPAIDRYRHRGFSLCVTLQNIAEFWNVATRQEQHRGFGRPIDEVAVEVDEITKRFTVLSDSRSTLSLWRNLVEEHKVKGVLVHDARLAAVMIEHSISTIFTLNPRDFARFPFITSIDPREAN